MKKRKIKKYRNGARLDNTVDSLGRVGLNMITPGLGEALAVSQGLSDAVRGDGTTFGQNLAADTLDPLSMIKDIGAGRVEEAIPIAGSLFKRNRMRKEERKREREENEVARRNAVRMSQRALSDFDTRGIEGVQFRKGGKMKKKMRYLEGGTVEPLSSDAMKFIGNTHEQGGIQLGDNAEVEDQEVMINGNEILSDSLEPREEIVNELKSSGVRIYSGDTYASIGERINRMKGSYEKTLDSPNRFEENSSKIMIDKLNNLSDLLFQDQEASKLENEEVEDNTFEQGGTVTEPPKFEFPFADEFARLFGMDDALNQARAFQQLPENVAKQEREFEGFRELIEDNPVSPNRPASLDTDQPFIKRFFSMLGETTRDRMEGIIDPDKKIGFKKGGKVKRYQTGGDLPPFRRLDTLGREVLDLDIPLPQTNTEIREVAIPFRDENRSGVGDFLSDNVGQIANLANFISNENVINRMETTREPNLVAQPVPRITDRTSQIRAMNDRSLREVLDAIDTGSVRDRNAARASALSLRIEGENTAILNELGRQDQLRAQYDNLAARINMANTDILNRTDLENLSRENELLALRQGNRDALVEGIIGNIAERDRRRMQELAIRLIANRQGDRGVVNRMLENDPNLRELAKIFG